MMKHGLVLNGLGLLNLSVDGLYPQYAGSRAGYA